MQVINRKVDANIVSINDLIRERVAKDFGVDPSKVGLNTSIQWSINSSTHLALRVYPTYINIDVDGISLEPEDYRKYDVLIVFDIRETEYFFDFIHTLKRMLRM